MLVKIEKKWEAIGFSPYIESYDNYIGSKYTEEAEKHGTNIDYEKARDLVYGMSYKEWKVKHQKEQTNARLQGLKEKFHDH